MSAQIASMGYEAVPTADPDEALRLVRVGRCRLVRADVHMPGMDGYEFLHRALQSDPGVHVIVMTSNVLIVGPTGTGKELVARAIHQISW